MKSSRSLDPFLTAPTPRTQNPDNVHLLLGLLDNPDIYCRINVMRLLTLLLDNDRTHLQNCILQAPQGVSRLIDMLKEGDMVRNGASPGRRRSPLALMPCPCDQRRSCCCCR